LVAIAFSPLAAYASGPGSTNHTTSASHASSGTPKSGSHTTISNSGNGTGNSATFAHDLSAGKTFPINNKGQGPKISKAGFDKLGNKKFDPDYKNKFGFKFDHGYYYKGKDHHHWSYCCWYPSYGCYCYWCPSTSCYYYWCQPDSCFYPISYCPYRVYSWPSCYVVPNIVILQCEPVVVTQAVVQTVVIQPAVVVYQAPVVPTVVAQQAVVAQAAIPAVAAPASVNQDAVTGPAPAVTQQAVAGPAQGVSQQAATTPGAVLPGSPR
jgi:hypothetical protein